MKAILALLALGIFAYFIFIVESVQGVLFFFAISIIGYDLHLRRLEKEIQTLKDKLK